MISQGDLPATQGHFPVLAQRLVEAKWHRPAESKLSDTDRMIAVIEAAAATFDAKDPAAVETLFAGQAVALDVIFKDFIRRRTCTFDSMRVALRAQAQCRSTFKTLADFRTPRPRVARNSNVQTIENGKSPG